MTNRKQSTRKAAVKTDGPPKIVVVTRLSDDRGGDVLPHTTQEDGCRKKADALGGEIVGVFHDENVSGDRLIRPGLDSAIAMIAAGEATMLLAYSIDRLARSQVVLATICHTVQAAGGTVQTVLDDLQEGPVGTFLQSAMAFAAELELVKIRERVNRANHARFVVPKRMRPGPKPLYGYSRVGEKEATVYVVNEAEADVVRNIFAWTAAGHSRYAIVQRLNNERVPGPTGGTWNPSAVARILSRDVYASGQRQCWRTQTSRSVVDDNVPMTEPRPVEDQYVVPLPAIVDAGIGTQAKVAIARNAEKHRRVDRDPSVGVLRYGFVRCSGCGRTLSVVPGKADTLRYHCTNPCAAPVSMSIAPLDTAIMAWVNDMIMHPTRAASRWQEVEERPVVDLGLHARLATAERLVAESTERVTTLAVNLASVTGPAAAIITEHLNAMNEDLTTRMAERDALAAEAAKRAMPAKRYVRRVSPETVIFQAGELALRSGWEAYRAHVYGLWRAVDADDASTVDWDGEMGALDSAEQKAKDRVLLPNPDSSAGWAAWQAAISSLNLSVTLNQERAEGPRWEAKMELPGGTVMTIPTHSSRNRHEEPIILRWSDQEMVMPAFEGGLSARETPVPMLAA